jgi:predicted RecA/RadA family phage recombinase
MATEILINDGGAPGRILPFVAGSTVSAGDPLQLTTDDEVDAGTVSGAKLLGVALTAASSGNIANVISGRGIIVKANCSGTIALGADVQMSGEGMLMDSKAAGNSVGVALEAQTGTTPSLKKVLLL